MGLVDPYPGVIESEFRTMAGNARIAYVPELLRQLMPSADAQPPFLSGYRTFSRPAEGTVVLNPSEIEQYSAVLGRLIRDFGKKEDISPSAIDDALQRAIFFAIDISKKHRQLSLEQRIEKATITLEQTLRRPATNHECYVPIKGSDLHTLPFRFGDVTFLCFNELQLRKLRRELRRGRLTEKEIRFFTDDIERSNTRDSCCARIRVKAKDAKAALLLAEKYVRTTVDSLNFFSDLVPYNYGWLHVPEEAVSASVTSLVLGIDGSIYLPHERRGPFPGFSFDKLRQAQNLQPLLRKIDHLLRRDGQRDIDSLLLSSIQWPGRASIASRREEAFLLFAIALETILLPTDDPRELSYRLRVRAAHLLESTPEKRGKIGRDIQKLYSTRSKIVHNGHYQITHEEWSRMRSKVKQVIVAILRSRAVARLRSREDLDQWFEKKILS